MSAAVLRVVGAWIHYIAWTEPTFHDMGPAMGQPVEVMIDSAHDRRQFAAAYGCACSASLQVATRKVVG